MPTGSQFVRSTAAIVGAALISVLVPSVGQAAGATAFSYSPMFCQPVGGSGTLKVWNQGQIGNSHPSETLNVFCPLIHELKEGHSGKIQINVIDASRDNGVECRAYFNHPHASESPPWNFNGWKNNHLGSGPDNKSTITLAGAEDLGGSHMIWCKIPPKDSHFNGDDGISRIGTYKSGID